MTVDISPIITNSQFFLTAPTGKSFEVSGTTKFTSHSTQFDTSSFHQGTYAFYAVGQGASISLLGDITAYVEHDKEAGPDEIGANLFYAKNDGTITLGQAETTTKAWVIAKTPDLISAKNGGKVNIKSTNNEFVGSIDFFLKPEEIEGQFDPTVLGQAGSSVKGTFVGANSYWYGDEHSFMNFAITNLPDDQISGLRNGMLVSEIASFVQSLDKDDPRLSKLQGVLGNMFETVMNYEITDSLDLTFSDGAEWSYLGQTKTGSMGTLTGGSVAKRISSITLNGGVVNLADEYLDMQWRENGLSDILQVDEGFKHDYVRIGDLKGSDGIFRIDLNGNDKSQSDMIFIESSSTGGTHRIEPYKLETLTNIANTGDTLIFAMTQKEANNVKFEDKANYYGETLYDYEVEIANKEIDQNVLKEYSEGDYIKYDDGDKNDGDLTDGFNSDDYIGGTAWFIQQVTLKQSTASTGMRSAGYASYDAAVQMDRHDRRLKETVFENGSTSGLWVRMQHGQMGAKGVYSSDINTVSVGAEGKLTDTLRLGASFSYLDGDADLADIKGSNDMERYEGSVYGTFESGAHYVDIVARFGQVNNDFMTSNVAVSKSGSFHQKYAAISAEYGYKLASNSGLFIEPQVQAQGAYLGSYDTTVAGGMRMKAEQTTSLIGRVGVRLGKTFKTEATSAEIYARGDVLHQFTDGQDAEQSNDRADRLSVSWGDAGTWYNYGIGGYLNWKNRFGAQFDVEKSSGGEVADTWLLSGRLSYYF